MIDSINQQLVLKFVNKREIRNNVECHIFEEQYNCLWWEREESSLLLGQRLLSIILYSDATTLDHMGKSSGHPIFLSLVTLVFRISLFSYYKIGFNQIK